MIIMFHGPAMNKPKDRFKISNIRLLGGIRAQMVP